MLDPDQVKEWITRRGFLSLASIGVVTLSSAVVLAGIVRIIKPSVYYEESKKFKIGKPESFPVGLITSLEDERIFIFSSNEGLHAISKICTHLGCIVALTESGFQCPCHGSKYNHEGRVVAGPAPRPLSWLEITQDVDGTLVVDANKEVKEGTFFKV